MDQAGEPSQKERLEGFNTLFYLTEAVGGLLILLMGIWIFNYRGGLAWTSNPAIEFNWHPLLMTIGLVFLYANGIEKFHIKTITFWGDFADRFEKFRLRVYTLGQ